MAHSKQNSKFHNQPLTNETKENTEEIGHSLTLDLRPYLENSPKFDSEAVVKILGIYLEKTEMTKIVEWRVNARERRRRIGFFKKKIDRWMWGGNDKGGVLNRGEWRRAEIFKFRNFRKETKRVTRIKYYRCWVTGCDQMVCNRWAHHAPRVPLVVVPQFVLTVSQWKILFDWNSWRLQLNTIKYYEHYNIQIKYCKY